MSGSRRVKFISPEGQDHGGKQEKNGRLAQEDLLAPLQFTEPSVGKTRKGDK
jgi:hypothetical protein